MHAFSRVLVAGLGKVGELVARLLQESGFEVVGADLARAGDATLPFPVLPLDVADPAALRRALEPWGAVRLKRLYRKGWRNLVPWPQRSASVWVFEVTRPG